METSPGTTPAQRVRAFVEARSQMTGPVDRGIVMDLWVKDVQHVLTFADLLALCDAAEPVQIEPVLAPYMMDGEFMVTDYLHADCEWCLNCADTARTYARVSGSIGATFDRKGLGPEIPHTATVRRSVSVTEEEVAALIERADRDHVLQIGLGSDVINVAKNRWAIEALAEMRGGWDKL